MLLDSNCWYTGTLTDEAINACSHSGSCDADVEFWVTKLEFTAEVHTHRAAVERYLREFGAWDDLQTTDDETLAQRLLWIACSDLKESGEWAGLHH